MTPIVPNFSPSWVLLAILVAIVIAVTSASRRRRRLDHGRWDVKVCGRCGTSQPPHAAYCRECGQHLA